MDETDIEFGATSKKRPRSTEKPRYFLLTAQYINDMYYASEMTIEGAGIIPNEGMQPQNQAAEDAMDAWLESLPSRPKRHEDFIMEAMMNRPRHEIPAPNPPAKKKPGRLFGKETSAETEISVVAEDNTRRGPKKQQGTIVHEVPSPGSM